LGFRDPRLGQQPELKSFETIGLGGILDPAPGTGPIRRLKPFS